jgi:hypothetical protein
MIKSRTDGQGMQNMWERHACKVFIEKSEGKKLMRRHSHTWKGKSFTVIHMILPSLAEFLRVMNKFLDSYHIFIH